MIQALQQHNIKKPANAGFANNWLEYLDSNQGNARFRVWCLTAWLYPNIDNAIILKVLCAFVKQIIAILEKFVLSTLHLKGLYGMIYMRKI